ncbi:hypothetical protein F5883DRAFT_663608 [Diaporthe sp. PMI_573]|nr:hypothetical protein F5883DRAFT_663608 [Diaporthaceae sp. PMI_573]
MPTKHSSTCLDRAMGDVSQHSGTESSSTSQARRDLSTRDPMNEIPLAHYPGSQYVTAQTTAHPAAGYIATLEERNGLEFRPVTEQDYAANYLQLLDPPVPPFPNDPASAAICDVPVEDRPPSASEERGFEEEVFLRPKLTKAIISVLAVVVLSLIVVPGVVLGVLMEQVQMGIALSGAVATVVGIFAGFYYYSKKD